MVRFPHVNRRMFIASGSIFALPITTQLAHADTSAIARQAGTAASLASEFHTVTPTDAEPWWFLGHAARIYGNSKRTGGAFDLIDFEIPPGFATPLHVHHTADEVFWILEGAIRGICNNEEWHAAAGDMVWLPKGLAHGFASVGSTPGRHLTMTLPGGFDAFVREVGEPMRDPNDSPPPIPDPATLAAIAARHGQTILGPPVSFKD